MPRMIKGSVGQGGMNQKNDAATIQYLLNCVPTAQGGPQKELVVDGLVGPLTIGAISRFQKTRLGFSDGRVDPGGKSFQALTPYDPNPNGAPVTPGAYGSKSGGKSGPYGKTDVFGKTHFGPGQPDPYGKTPSGKTPPGQGKSDPYGKTPFFGGKVPGGKTPGGGYKT